MSLETFVSSSISSTAQLVAKKSFSDVLIFGQHDAFSARVKTYEGAGSTILTAMKADGLTEKSAQYRAVEKALGMTNAARKFIIGRRAAGTKQRSEVVIGAVVADTEYFFDYSAKNGIVTRLIMNSGAAPVTIGGQRDLEIALINASGIPVTATANAAGSYFVDADFFVEHTIAGDGDKTITNALIAFDDSAETVSDALDACETLVDFVGVAGLSPEKATLMAVSAWGASRENVMTGVLTSDADIVTGGIDTDVVSLLQVLASGFVFVDTQFWNSKHVGLLTDRLSTNIDAGTLPRFNAVYLKGYATGGFSSTERGVLLGKGAFLTSKVGVKAVTYPHVKPMSGERPHVVLGKIWFNQRIKEQVAALVIERATNDGGLDLGEDGLFEVRAEMNNIHASAVRMKLCSSTPMILTGLTEAEITQVEKDAESLIFGWEAELRNSILSATVKGSLVTQISTEG